MNQTMTQSLQQQLNLDANQQVIESLTKNNLENWEEYVKLIETPYWNLMLDRQVLITKGRHVGHMLFLPQKVV